MDELVKYMRALTFLQLQAMTGNGSFGKPEVLLAKAGFNHREVADILGKNVAAVSKAISRAKATAEKEDGNE